MEQLKQRQNINPHQSPLPTQSPSLPPIMPLLWKKKKSGGGGGTISRLMADFQSPSKRGGSLVVETGFPTSLIDLFVKNRDRMNKSSRRIKREKQQGPIIEIEEAPTVPLVDDLEVLSRAASEVDRASSSDEQERGLDGAADSEAVDQRPDRSFLAIPMVVILGLLAMFPKWLVIGATIAASLLGLAEFILGAPVTDSLKPCIYGPASFKGLKISRKIKRDSPSNPDPVKSVSVSTGLKQVSGEIEVSVSKSELDGEAEVDDGLSPPNTEVVIMDGNQKQMGRRSKLRSKIMKKMVPKKIRNQKKKGEGDCRI